MDTADCPKQCLVNAHMQITSIAAFRSCLAAGVMAKWQAGFPENIRLMDTGDCPEHCQACANMQEDNIAAFRAVFLRRCHGKMADFELERMTFNPHMQIPR